MASILEIAKKINKEFKNNNLIITGDLIPKVEKLPTRALGMDYPLFGGLPYKNIIEYSGLPHSGKTTAACCELAAYQEAHPEKTCVYVDAEHRLNTSFQAEMNFIEWSKVLIVNIPAGMSGEQVLDLIIEIEQSDDIGLIILDSIPALLPAAVIKADMTEDPGMRATLAKKLYPFLAEMQTLLCERGNIFLIINQIRDGGTINGMPIYKEPCGFAIQFWASVIIRFGKRKFTLLDNMNACGASNGEGSDGFRLQFKIIKNSTANPTRGGGFITYRYKTGLDWLNDLIEIAEGFDFIVKSGAYRTLVNCETGEPYYDKEGKILKAYMKELKAYIEENTDFREEYIRMLQNHISASNKSYGSLLSKEDSAEIDMQEAAIAKINEEERKAFSGTKASN